jgi:hypothetical protein
MFSAEEDASALAKIAFLRPAMRNWQWLVKLSALTLHVFAP